MGLIQEYVGFQDSPELDVKINTIIDFWSNPCNAPYTVYVETLYPALGRMFLALVDTSLLDIARSYLRPREGLTRGNKRKKGRRRGRIPRIPDSADMFARMIPGATIWEGMEYGANTKFLWQIDGVIQRGLWYIVILDATTDGLYYWAQGIKKEQFCQPTARPGMFATNPHPLATAAFGVWIVNAGFTVQWAEAGFGYFIGRLTLPPGTWVFAYYATYANNGHLNGLVQVRVKGAGTAGIGEKFLGPNETGDLHFSVTLKGGETWTVEQRALGTPFIDGHNGIISVKAP